MPPQQTTLHGARVRRGACVPEIADPVLDARSPASDLIADRDRAVLRIDGVGTFGVEHGERVCVAAEPGAEAGIVDAYLNSTVAALLLGQRGQFALHANSVSVGGRAAAIAGDTGAGKSTTSVRLLQRGHRHLTDDLSVLEPGIGGVVLHPTDRGLRLWPETAELLGVDVTGATRPISTSEKVVLGQPPAQPVRLHAIVIVERAGDGDVELERVHGARALEAVLAHAYRAEIMRRIWPGELFAWAAEVAGSVATFRIARPEHGWTVDAVVAAVEGAVVTRPATSGART